MANNENTPPVDETPESETTDRIATLSSVNETFAWFEDAEVDEEGIAAAPARTVVGIDRETYDELGEPASVIVTVQSAD